MAADEDYFVSEIFAFKSNPADLNDPGKVHDGCDDFSFPDRPPPNAACVLHRITDSPSPSCDGRLFTSSSTSIVIISSGYSEVGI